VSEQPAATPPSEGALAPSEQPAVTPAASEQQAAAPPASAQPVVAPAVAAVPPTRAPRGLGAWRTAFRHWRRARPFWGGLLCVLGGLEIAYFPAHAFKYLLSTNGNVVLGVAVGLGVALMGLLLWFAPSQRHLGGLLAILFAMVSVITSTFGGLLIGLLLGTIGGALGFAWSPVRPVRRAASDS
jgi:hypothetical protein